MSQISSSDPSQEPRNIPLLPLRDIVIFPHMVVPLFVGRERSIAALDEAMSRNKDILLAAQRDARINDPSPDDVFSVGTLGAIRQLLRLPDGTVKVLVEGRLRVGITNFVHSDPFYLVETDAFSGDDSEGVEVEALARSLKVTFETYVKLNKAIQPEMIGSIQSIEDPSMVADTIAAHLSLKLEQKQDLLEEISARRRLELLHGLMQSEIEILQVEKRIRSRVKRQMDRSQKEYYLNEQMQAIQKELGERDDFRDELTELEDRVRKVPLSREARQRLDKELGKLKMMAPMSAEATVVRNYVDWVLDLPWGERTADELDIDRAEEILDEDHYGLRKVKERIVEYLAVQSLVEKMKGPILCFVGPPGVGKTSLGRSIARATGRKFVRLSLGGVRDEAEIRGHRRTYIGALPGKVLQYLHKAGSNNPVFLLDEVDKMSADFRGDPASALLEVLDPEQNHTFNDHYLDLDYDLSDVMFITTANTLAGIPLPLQDRMEIIELPGYTEREKLQIARRYLLPKQIKANGLSSCKVGVADEVVIRIVHEYTKEAGVRNLERELAAICRKVARKKVKKPAQMRFRVAAEKLERYLGVPKFLEQEPQEKDDIGFANGLAVTFYGGELLVTEVTVMPGKGQLQHTGKLGDVMKESAQAALSYVRSRAASFGLDVDFYQHVDIHVHCPEGAIPKDGPSAGITMATAMVSALLRVPVRRDVAMTGEITLRGRVLPIGGLRDKLLAAKRSRIATVLIPAANEKDLADIPSHELEGLEIHAVKDVDEVLRRALRLGDASFLAESSEILDWRLSQRSPSSVSH
ncbi:MAG: endopeptidase La [Deltaproteobacteria bacterium]|nr:endopeptidase La [Deltaproteobacteria bacterium]